HPVRRPGRRARGAGGARMRLNAKDVLDATDGVLIGAATARADSYAIDTRRLEPGGCFLAVQGDRDGNDFVDHPSARGASIVVVTRPPQQVPEGCAAVNVSDTLAALASLGRAARHRLAAATVVGITGSAGKTATKDLLAAALGRTHRVHASPAAFNNDAGGPLTPLPTGEDTEVLATHNR